MTVKELREVKKSLKAAEQAAAESEHRAEQAEASKQFAIQQHTEQQGKFLAHTWIDASACLQPFTYLHV
ncbi:hypothetical protein [Fontibacillus panacisegetis]|nr:hypothetical protein [Fontibacillus panacisegetis]